MPIFAKVHVNKITRAILDLLDSIKKNKKIRVHSIKINGYFLYRYRGILLVRKGFSDVLIIHDYNAVKKYLMHVINSVLRSDYILWAKTSGLVEIIIEAEKKSKSGVIFIEASNDKINDHGNFMIRVITHDKMSDNKEKMIENKPLQSNSYSEDIIDLLDETVINEDLRKLTPIDIYDFFEVNEVEDIIKTISRISDNVSIADSAEIR